MSSPSLSDVKAYSILIAATYLPAIFWAPSLSQSLGDGLILFAFSPVCLAWLLWDMWFPLMPYGPTGFWGAAVVLLFAFFVLVALLTALICRSKTLTICGAAVLFFASLAQGIAFAIRLPMLA